MADLSPEETQALFGFQPTAADIEAQRRAMEEDPFGAAWDMITGGDKTLVGRIARSQGVGPDATRTGNEAHAMAGGLQLQRDVRNAPAMDAIFRQGAMSPDRANPYNAGIADQSRAAQLALMQQMRGQMNGPSLAAMQGQRALGQSGQQALMQGALGNQRAAMLQAGQVGGGLASDVARARLAEMMRAQGGIGGAAGSLRGGDLRSAEAQMRAGLQQRTQDDQLRQFYATLGANLDNARSQARGNREVTRLQLLAKSNMADAQAAKDVAQAGAGLAAGAVK